MLQRLHSPQLDKKFGFQRRKLLKTAVGTKVFSEAVPSKAWSESGEL
jgi:hypothetical protein